MSTDDDIQDMVNKGLVEITKTGYGKYAELIRHSRNIVYSWYQWIEYGKINRN